MGDEEKKTDIKGPCEPNEVRQSGAKPQKTTEAPRITNDEKPQVNEVVNKKLAAMSKETKARRKKKLEKPPKDEHTETAVTTMTDNQMFLLLGIIGVIIAGVSLYYQRRSANKDKKHVKEIEDRQGQDVKQQSVKHDHAPYNESKNLPEPLIRW